MKNYKEGYKVNNPELKHCWLAPTEGEYKYQRYILESLEDVKRFLNHEDFDHVNQLKNLIVKPWKNHIKNGRVLLVCDNYALSGFPAYSFKHETDEILEVIDNA